MVPEVIPFTMPEADPILAAVPPTLHNPPATASFIVVAMPAHIPAAPVMAAGEGFTVTVAVV